MAAPVIAPSVSFAQSTDELSALNRQVSQLHRDGKYAEAIPIAEHYVAVAKEKHGDEHIEYATAIAWLGLIYKAQGRYRQAEPLYKRALVMQHSAFYRYREFYPRRNGSLRNCCSHAGDERSAVPVCV